VQELTKLIVSVAGGEAREIEYSSGSTAMEVIRDAGIEDMIALCGGVLSCATCHVHVDPAFADRLPAMTEDESDLLDCSSHRNAYSRLSCQIHLTDELAGIKMTVVEPD
jgi:2Fe-2S ferredoxin